EVRDDVQSRVGQNLVVADHGSVVVLSGTIAVIEGGHQSVTSVPVGRENHTDIRLTRVHQVQGGTRARTCSRSKLEGVRCTHAHVSGTTQVVLEGESFGCSKVVVVISGIG